MGSLVEIERFDGLRSGLARPSLLLVYVGDCFWKAYFPCPVSLTISASFLAAGRGLSDPDTVCVLDAGFLLLQGFSLWLGRAPWGMSTWLWPGEAQDCADDHRALGGLEPLLSPSCSWLGQVWPVLGVF